MNFLMRGQTITITTAIIGGTAMIVAAGVTSWGTSSVQTAVIQEREQNHYEQVQKDLNRIEAKLDRVILEK